MPRKRTTHPRSHGRRGARAAGGNGRKPRPSRPKPPFPEQHQKKPGLELKLKPRPQYRGVAYHPADKLKGKVALITGGDSGIGKSVAVLFAREGADVAIVYLPEEEPDAKRARRAIEAEGRRAVLIPGDVGDAEFCRRAVERAVRELGRLDILVNNAAYQESKDRIEDISDEQWEHTFRTNIFSYFYLARAAVEHMKPGSCIINCGSVTSLRGSARLLDYSSTKGAIEAFTKSLAEGLVGRGIRVNCVAPGPVWTPLNPSDLPAGKVAHFGEKAPMGRPAQPEEIAPAFVFFASDGDSSYVSGEILAIQGGEVVS